MPSLRRAFTPQMHYAENECAMPMRLHCNELRALCLTTNTLCRTAEFGALLLKCVLIVYIWPEKGVMDELKTCRSGEAKRPVKKLNRDVGSPSGPDAAWALNDRTTDRSSFRFRQTAVEFGNRAFNPDIPQLM